MAIKLVRENINEFFKKNDDKISSLGLGRKYMIKKWLEEFNITMYTINRDFTIDVFENVALAYRNLIQLPDYIQFGKIIGVSDYEAMSFDICNNKLITLKGCPREVYGKFDCDHNELTSLEFGPTVVRGSYFCGNNKLTTLKGCPSYIGKNFNVDNNKLTSLEFGPTRVGVSYFCHHNNLTSLKWTPRIIPGDFWCKYNPLTTLDDAPTTIEGELSLEGTDISFLTEKEIRKHIKVFGKIYK